MPPRYAYWTILVDGQPTAFRAASQEDLMPTFNRLKEKHPSAVMQWFQNGKLWPSRIDAQEAMRARGEMGRRGDSRQGGFRTRKRFDSSPRTQDSGPKTEKLDWIPKTQDSRPKTEKLDWKPKGEFTPAPKRERSERPEWRPKTQHARPKTQDSRPRTFRSEKPEWKPKGSFDRDRKPRPQSREKLEWRPKTQDSRPRTQDSGPKTSEKRKWVPKEEYKKSKGIEAPRDSKWRPGGAHRDPKQKYKDAKKAKWSKFKKTIRTRWEAKKKNDK